MATSGSKDFTVTRNEIIDAALRKIGEFDAGEPASGADTQDASRALNLMIKGWVGQGIDIWLRQTCTLFLDGTSQNYSLGPSGDHFTASYVETAVALDIAASGTTLTVLSTTGMTAADNIGIKLDDLSLHWDTISSVDSATQITLTTGVASAATAGRNVYAYTTKSPRPQKIIYAHRRDTLATDTEIDLIGEKEYRRLSRKAATGRINQIWYQPTLTNGTLYVWPVSNLYDDKLVLITENLPDDFDTGADNPEFPPEWANTIVWGLAAELSWEYGLPLQDRLATEAKAKALLNDMLDYDVENASFRIEAEVRGR